MGLDWTLHDRMEPSMNCPFCLIVTGKANADFVYRDTSVCVFRPLNPVVPSHLLVVPVQHVADFTEDVAISALTMMVASSQAREMGPVNLITSKGTDATQSVFHLHIHLVPRHSGDGLHLPWTGQIIE